MLLRVKICGFTKGGRLLLFNLLAILLYCVLILHNNSGNMRKKEIHIKYGMKWLCYEKASCAEGREAMQANNCMPGLQEATPLCERAKHGSGINYYPCIIICK